MAVPEESFSAVLDRIGQKCTTADLRQLNSLASHIGTTTTTTSPALSAVLAFLSVTANGIFVAAGWYGIRKARVPLKAYSFLLTRSVVDGVCALVLLFFLSLRGGSHQFSVESSDWSPDKSFQPAGAAVDDNLSTVVSVPYIHYVLPGGQYLVTFLVSISGWVSAVCYSLNALLALLAIHRPLLHMKLCTERFIVRLSLLTVLGGVGLSLILTVLAASPLFANFDSRPIALDLHMNARDIVRAVICMLLLLIDMLAVSIANGLVAHYLWFKHASIGTSAQRESLRRVLLNMGAFLTTCIVMMLTITLPLALYHKSRPFRIGRGCVGLYHALSNEKWTVDWGLASTSLWLLRQVTDPVMNLCLDRRFSEMLESWVPSHSPSSISTQRIPASNTMMQFMAKCAAEGVVPQSARSIDGRAAFRFVDAPEKEARSARVVRFDDILSNMSAITLQTARIHNNHSNDGDVAAAPK